MNVRAPPVFRSDEFGDLPPQFLETLTRALRAQYDALATASTRVVRSGVFTSAASGVSTVSVKNPLGTKPQHVTVALRRDDLADFSAAWSWWHVVTGDQIQVKFIGLPASIRHAYTIELS